MKTITALELFNQGKSKIPLELLDNVIVPVSNGWGTPTNHVLNTLNIIVISIGKSAYVKNALQLNYITDTSPVLKVVAVAHNFKFKLPQKEQVKKLRSVMNKYVISNLKYELSYNSSIGSDPEIFLEKDGKVLSAFDFLGSKANPNKVPGYAGGTNDIYWDGFQAEFTTHPSHCMGWHGDSLHYGLKGVYELLKKHDPEAKLSIKTVMDIPEKLLKKSKEEHVAFGCLASFNAYGMEGMKGNGREVDFRTAGGHIHFGTGVKDKKDADRIVKALDMVLGVVGVSLFAKFDDPRRRSMYGLAGEYRLPPHGLEYRTLSNAWLFHPAIANIIFDLGRTVYKMGEKNHKLWDASEEETIEVINTSDVKGARKILKRNEEILKELIKVRFSETDGALNARVDYVYNAIMNGMESIVKDPTDFVKNWNLTGGWVGHCDGKKANIKRIFENGNEKEKL